MNRWRIADEKAFLVRCMIHAPALGGALFALVYSIAFYVLGFPTYTIEQVPVAFLFTMLLMIPGAVIGVLIGALPGALGGAALLLVSHFRSPATIDFVVVAALMGGLLGQFLWVAGGQYSVWYLPYAVALTAAVSALALAPAVRSRGIVVRHDVALVSTPLPVAR